MTVEEFEQLKRRASAATEARQRAERDLAVADGALASVARDIEDRHGAGMADPLKLEAAEKAARAEADRLAGEIDRALTGAGF